MHLPFIAPVAGISFRRNAAASAFEGEPITIEPDDSTPDPNAMAVCGSDGRRLGYLPAPLAAKVCDRLGRRTLQGRIAEVLGDPADEGGLRIEVVRQDDEATAAA